MLSPMTLLSRVSSSLPLVCLREASNFWGAEESPPSELPMLVVKAGPTKPGFWRWSRRSSSSPCSKWFLWDSRRCSSREVKQANISTCQWILEDWFKMAMAVSLEGLGTMGGLLWEMSKSYSLHLELASVNKALPLHNLICTPPQQGLVSETRVTDEEAESAEGQICQRPHSWAEAEPSWPSHFPLQHKNQTSKGSVRGPGSEERRISRAEL